MIKINPSITIELEKGGRQITIDFDEARQIIKNLAKLVQEGGRGKKSTRQKGVHKRRQRVKKAQKLTTRKMLHMSDTKRKEILQHIDKQLSARPKTLSNLLHGISYVPNYLPDIRRMVESQRNVAKRVIGKRIFYVRR
jgi:enoyl-[acyl-carrier-protein] reductase (NADH)